jgi:transposase
MGHAAGLAGLERQSRLGAIERLDLMGWMAPSRHRCAKLVAVEHHQGGAIHMDITTVGLDLAKHVFQVHGVDEAGDVIVKRRLRRAQVITYFASLPPCLIGMEACATAHFWARELRALGHEVRLMPPQYVKAYVKRGKNDAADAAAICEAVTRPSMRVVPVKTEQQQSALMMHRARELLVRQRTQLINAVRGHLAEFGLVEAQGPWNVPRLLASMQEDRRVPELARQVLQLLAAQLDEVGKRIAEVDVRIAAWYKASPVSRRLATIPGIGPLIATAIAATVPDPDAFRGGREFAAWLGLVPRQTSTGGKQRLGRISRLGDKYIRQLLIVGAQTVLLRSKAARSNAWIQGLLARRPRLVVAVALANKMARVVWAVMAKGQSYRQAAPA